MISADAVREVQLKRGQMAIALIKSIEVMIVQFG
jgi:molybdopterin-binding protein